MPGRWGPEPDDYNSLLRHIDTLIEQGRLTAGIAMRLDGSAFLARTLAEATMQTNVVASWEISEFAKTPKKHRRALLVGRYSKRLWELYRWAHEQQAANDSAARSGMLYAVSES